MPPPLFQTQESAPALEILTVSHLMASGCISKAPVFTPWLRTAVRMVHPTLNQPGLWQETLTARVTFSHMWDRSLWLLMIITWWVWTKQAWSEAIQIGLPGLCARDQMSVRMHFYVVAYLRGLLTKALTLARIPSLSKSMSPSLRIIFKKPFLYAHICFLVTKRTLNSHPQSLKHRNETLPILSIPFSGDRNVPRQGGVCEWREGSGITHHLWWKGYDIHHTKPSGQCHTSDQPTSSHCHSQATASTFLDNS